MFLLFPGDKIILEFGSLMKEIGAQTQSGTYFTLLNTGVEWGADGRKLHPFSTCPVPDFLRARVTQPWPLQFAPGTLAKVAGDRPEARTSAHLEVSRSSHLCNGLGSGGRGRAC